MNENDREDTEEVREADEEGIEVKENGEDGKEVKETAGLEDVKYAEVEEVKGSVEDDREVKENNGLEEVIAGTEGDTEAEGNAGLEEEVKRDIEEDIERNENAGLEEVEKVADDHRDVKEGAKVDKVKEGAKVVEFGADQEELHLTGLLLDAAVIRPVATDSVVVERLIEYRGTHSYRASATERVPIEPPQQVLRSPAHEIQQEESGNLKRLNARSELPQ